MFGDSTPKAAPQPLSRGKLPVRTPAQQRRRAPEPEPESDTGSYESSGSYDDISQEDEEYAKLRAASVKIRDECLHLQDKVKKLEQRNEENNKKIAELTVETAALKEKLAKKKAEKPKSVKFDEEPDAPSQAPVPKHLRHGQAPAPKEVDEEKKEEEKKDE